MKSFVMHGCAILLLVVFTIAPVSQAWAGSGSNLIVPQSQASSDPVWPPLPPPPPPPPAP